MRIVVVWLLCCCVGSAGAECLSGRVVAVSDGDTLAVSYQGERYLLRLAGIDAPEVSHYGSLVQPFGLEARDYLRQVVGLDICVEVVDHDQYGRYIVDAWYQDIWLNAEMVRAGFAWVYRYYSNDPYLIALELDAESIRAGLWADDDPIYPATFRRMYP